LTSVNGQKASVPRPLQGQRISLTEVEKNDFNVKLDYRKVFNACVVGLYRGEKPPFIAASQKDLPRCIEGYEALATKARQGDSPLDYYKPAQAAALLKKLEDAPFSGGSDPADVAIAEWWASEDACKETNRRLWDLKNSPLTLGSTLLGRTIEGIRKEIFSLLGEFPPEYSTVARFGKYGPGVSLTTRQDEKDPILKTINPSILPSLEHELDYLKGTMMGECMANSYWGCNRLSAKHFQRESVVTCDYAKIAVVPKNFRVGRTIEIGGSLTTWIQQAYDGHVRLRMRDRWGLDLSDQRPNQVLAYRGSLDGRSCTIDLKNASDRNAYGLVASVFSAPWFRCLNACTNRFAEVDGERVRLEKFSAMGNALTFSLQTVIFAALVRSIYRERGLSDTAWRVYGDDIIVDRDVYDEVILRLKAIGATPNSLKSFSQGNFRESCGADYLLGTDVRPLYISRPIHHVADLIKYLNMIQIQVNKCPLDAVHFEPLYKYLSGLVPQTYKVFGAPSRFLQGYIWIPEKYLSVLDGLPKLMLGETAFSMVPNDEWGYRRQLLTSSTVESSLRPGKKNARNNAEKYRRTHSRPGIKLLGSEWLWVRSPMTYEAVRGLVVNGVFPY
jgi:hypothetical protein